MALRTGSGPSTGTVGTVGPPSETGRDPRPVPGQGTEATRYLCAAAYLDPRFRDSVLDQVFDRTRRFIAPSHGVDVAGVVRHCVEARRRVGRRDAILTGILLASLVIGPLALVLVFLAGVVILIDSLITRYRIVAGGLSRNRFDPAGTAPARPDVEERLSELARDEKGNVVVYSGYSPFVGSGFEVGAWSFAVNVRRPNASLLPEAPVAEFAADEIHRHVARAVGSLPFGDVTVEDRLFVSGRHIRGDQRFLPDQFSRPRGHVSAEVMERALSDPTPVARVYMEIRVVDWQGELVFSTFVRFSKTGDCLFMEASHLVLPSLRNQYHEVDELSPVPTWRRLAVLGGRAFGGAPFVMLASAGKTAARLAEPVRRWAGDRSARRDIRENQAFDYGARTSIREAGTATAYQRYFQLLDKEMYLKVVDRCLLDTVVAFLDDKGIDTSDLRSQTQHIYNSGVIISKSVVNSQNVAAGAGIRATAVNALQTAATAAAGSGGAR